MGEDFRDRSTGDGEPVAGLADRPFGWLRHRLHQRYVRAAAAGLSLTVIGCSLGAAALEIRHEVSHRAVLRYFVREHLYESDLTPRLKNYATASHLIAVANADPSGSGGGLVYAQGAALRFYPHETSETLTRRQEQQLNATVFPRLTAAYYAADLEALIAELDSPEVQARLASKEVPPALFWHLKRGVRGAVSQPDRHRLLRRAAELIRFFVPYSWPRYELPFPEMLRFYERLDPPGHFVGIYEVVGISLSGLDESYGHEMSRRNHFITISTTLDGAFVVTDFYRDSKRTYSIRPVLHPSGFTLYKVSERTAPGPSLFPRLG